MPKMLAYGVLQYAQLAGDTHVPPLRPPNEAEIERYWRIDRRNWPGFIKAVFNVAPTTQVPILVQAHDRAIASKSS